MPSTKKSGKGMMRVWGLTGQIVYGLMQLGKEPWE